MIPTEKREAGYLEVTGAAPGHGAARTWPGGTPLRAHRGGATSFDDAGRLVVSLSRWEGPLPPPTPQSAAKRALRI